MGELMSIGAALVWSISVILFKQMAPFTPVGMNMFKNAIAIACLCVTLLALGIQLTGPQYRGLILLIVSGVLGIGVADTLFFAGLKTRRRASCGRRGA